MDQKSTPNKAANILCIVSLVLMLFAPVTSLLIGLSLTTGDTNSTVYGMISFFSCVFAIAAWILVIIARVKYKTTFSKVLLIIYIVLTVLGIIAFIFSIVVFGLLVFG
ncbi:MAG: hypothetical protein IJ757_03580 [Clostridiales bacterium]|nr:hypothetical protein [Clostridiales bacterium]